jgi:hypothetical protein
MDLEVQEVKLAEEQACGLHSFDGRDLSMEIEGIHARVDGIEGERITEARQLSQLVVEISNALVDLGMLPVPDIPHLPKSAHKVLMVASLLLERMREVQASGTGPWD